MLCVPFALVVVVEEHISEVRPPHGRRVDLLLGGIGQLVVEDSDGVITVASLKGMARSALVVDTVCLDHAQGTENVLFSVIVSSTTSVMAYS